MSRALRKRFDQETPHVSSHDRRDLVIREVCLHEGIGYGYEAFAGELERSPVRDRVTWRRNVGEAELVRLYAQADVLLWASLNEGFGLPPLEAMACGTAVVASCVTSMPEVLGDAAFLVEPTDEERIFEATRRLAFQQLRRPLSPRHH